jgi:predicted MFS family arabinose efflux permease
VDGAPREAWVRLGACTAAAALLQIDGTIITVALPSVAHGLRVSTGSTSTVLSAYFAAYAVMLLPGGVLVDRLGPRAVAMAGLTGFAFGAAAGATTSSFGPLIVARVVQGASAGLVSPAALAGAVSGFAPEQRGSALGIWGASAGIANLLGPLIGGVLTVAFGWRANWWALVPLTALAFGAIVCTVPSRGPRTPIAARQPVLNRVVVLATLIAGVTFAVMIGSFYIAEQYLQRRADFSALGASSVLVVVAGLVGVAAPLAGRLSDERGERSPTVLGFLLAGIGLAVLAIPTLSLQSAFALAPLVPVGVGLGLLFVPTSRAALNANPSAAHGRTSAVLSIGRLLGAAIGTGLAGLALTAGPAPSTVHAALLVASALCVVIGIPAAMRLGRPGIALLGAEST